MKENFLEGCVKQPDGRYLIREQFTVVPQKVPLKEEVLREDGTHAKNEYIFKIWDNKKNLNGRNYSKVIPIALKKFKDSVTWTLMNHPEDDEVDVKDNAGVARNPFMSTDGWLSVHWIPTTRHGDDIARTFDNGGPVCVSSSVFGNLDDDGYVMDDDTFELDRWFDFVYCPSNRVVHFNDGHTEMKESVEESKTTIINNENTNSVESMEENSMDNNLAEDCLALNVKGLIKDALKVEDIQTRKNSLNEAKVFAEKLTDKSLLEYINSEIEKCNEEVLTLVEKGKKVESLEKSIEEKNAEVEKLENVIAENNKLAGTKITEFKNELDNKSKELNEESEKSMAINEQLEIMQKLYENIVDEKKVLVEKINVLTCENKTLNSTINALEEESKTFKENVKKQISESKKLTEAKLNSQYVSVKTVESMQEEIDGLKNTIKSLRKKLVMNVTEKRSNPTVKPNIEKTEKETIKESTNVDEDLIMERMLSGKYETKHSLSESVKNSNVSSDEDNIMEKMLSGNY